MRMCLFVLTQGALCFSIAKKNELAPPLVSSTPAYSTTRNTVHIPTCLGIVPYDHRKASTSLCYSRLQGFAFGQ